MDNVKRSVGRPLVGATRKNLYNFTLSLESRDKLQALAKFNGVSASRQVEIAVEKLWDAADPLIAKYIGVEDAKKT